MIVVEIEPEIEEFGQELSSSVAAVVDDVGELVVRLAVDDDVVRQLNVAPIGGSASARIAI